MIAVTFSLQDESRDFLRRLRVLEKGGRGVGSHLRAELDGLPLSVWHIGVGRESARQEGRNLLAHLQPSVVVCAGYAGALLPDLRIADVVLDCRDPNLRYRFALTSGMREGRVVTIETVAETVAEKTTLGKQSGALAVDMETGVLRELCDAAGVPLLAVRSISDRLEDALPVPMAHWFDMRRQRPRHMALLGYLAAHPGQILPFARFVRNLSPARRALAATLVELLPQLKG